MVFDFVYTVHVINQMLAFVFSVALHDVNHYASMNHYGYYYRASFAVLRYKGKIKILQWSRDRLHKRELG